MEIRKIVGADKEIIKDKLTFALRKLGYSFNVNPKGAGFEIRNIRLSDEYVKKHGRNFSPFTGRRGRILGWHNWVQINNAVNNVLDRMDVSANIKSLGGKFKIRYGKHRFTEGDWEELAHENVGSMIEPVARKDAWLSEKELETWRARRLAKIL